MSRIPVAAGSPQTVTATATEQKTIVGQVGSVSYSNTDGSGTLTAGQSVTVENNTTLTVASGRGYVSVLDVFGSPDKIDIARLSEPVASASDGSDGQRPVVGDGRFALRDPDVLNVKLPPFDAQGDGQTTNLGSISSGSNVFAATYLTFTSADIGKLIKVRGAGVAGATLKTTISGIGTGANAGKALLAGSASTTVSDAHAAWGTDDTEALQAALDAASNNDGARGVRKVFLPQGFFMFTQLVVPKAVMIEGTSWGDFGNIFTQSSIVPGKNNTILYQLWDTNEDAIVFTEAFTGPPYFFGPLSLANFMLIQDRENTAGSGIVTRDADGNFGNPEDGFRAYNVSASGFAEDGWKIGSGVPFYPDQCHAFANARYGISLDLRQAHWVTNLRGFSGDQNGECLVYARGDSGGATPGTLVLTTMKSEAKTNNYRTEETGVQDTAVILEHCGGLAVSLIGCMHGRSGAESTAPGPMVTIQGTHVPRIDWIGCHVRVGSGQTGGNPVMIDDEIHPGTTVARDISTGSYGYAALASATSTGHAGNNRRMVIGGDGEYVEAASQLEDAALAAKGLTPALALQETDGPTNRKYFKWVSSAGIVQLRRMQDDGSAHTILLSAKDVGGLDTIDVPHNLDISTAGKGLRVKEGSNAKQGTATLAAGTVTVSNTSVTANSRIFLTIQSLGTVSVAKPIAVTARTAGTSFTITSADNTDTSVVAYEIFEPAS